MGVTSPVEIRAGPMPCCLSVESIAAADADSREGGPGDDVAAACLLAGRRCSRVVCAVLGRLDLSTVGTKSNSAEPGAPPCRAGGATGRLMCHDKRKKSVFSRLTFIKNLFYESLFLKNYSKLF